MLEVCEILGRSSQGHTKPFICRCSDGQVYFVKGLDATRSSQVHEWIAGNMAKDFGLPIAHFALVYVDPVLAEAPEAKGIGAGAAFGSRRLEVSELNRTNINDIPVNLQRDVFAFDWWVRNNDRYLSAEGGNPNLFWEPAEEQLVVIDHNMAFDIDFSKSDILSYHVFKDQAEFVIDDLVTRAEYESRFDQALLKYDDYANQMPEEWSFSDEEQTVPASWVSDRPGTREILAGHKLNNFWRSAE